MLVVLVHYYWNEEIPDSTTLDFNDDPIKFFNNLLSKQDRFSWCDVNRNYHTRGINQGSTVSFDMTYTFTMPADDFYVYAFYLEVVQKQEAYYTAPVGDVIDKVEDFSTAPSEE